MSISLLEMTRGSDPLEVETRGPLAKNALTSQMIPAIENVRIATAAALRTRTPRPRTFSLSSFVSGGFVLWGMGKIGALILKVTCHNSSPLPPERP